MGTFKIEITAVGGHGQDRSKKDGEVVDFLEGGPNTPEACAIRFIEDLKRIATWFGSHEAKATITHWPGQTSEVVDDLLTGVRKGNF